MKENIAIIGCGPAGIFSAYQLIKNGYEGHITIYEKGKNIYQRKCPMRMKEGTSCVNCKTCNIMSGFGGAGTFSDCKLSLSPVGVGGNIADYIGEEKAKGYAEIVENIFNEFDEDKYKRVTFGSDLTKDAVVSKMHEKQKDMHFDEYTEFMRENSDAYNMIDVTYNPTKHLGTDGTYKVMCNMYDWLNAKPNIHFMFETEVKDIEKFDENNYRLSFTDAAEERRFHQIVILAPGRVGNGWAEITANKLGIETKRKHADIGFRVETDAKICEDITSMLYDMKLSYEDTEGNKIRTFCVNPKGYVSEEHYDKYAVANGHSFADKKSDKTNFSLLVTLNDDCIDGEFARTFMKLVNKATDNKIAVQNLMDYINNYKTQNVTMEQGDLTLKSTVPVNFNNIYPKKVIDFVTDFIRLLHYSYMPGIWSDRTWLYGPEVKFYSKSIVCDNNFETSLRNFYVAGDGVGITRGIIQSAINGCCVADAICMKTKE